VLQQEARERILKKQKDITRYYNRKCIDNVMYDLREVVAMSIPPTSGESSKLQIKYRGPLQVIKVLPSDTYHVASVPIDGGWVYSATAHVSQLKQWRLVKEEDNVSDEEDSLSEEEDVDSVQEDLNNEESNESDNKVTEKPLKRSRRPPAYLGDYIQ